MDRGGSLALHNLTPSEKKSATQVGSFIKKHKIRLAAVDLVENRVTDFNFTSPGLLVQMETLLGKNLAEPIVESLFKPYPI